MEQTKGYVYAMINPSYKDLVKIGKTTKDPEERAKELSSATGVATPFIVVYKRFFNNCTIAEKQVHTILTEQGCRVNDSREFFSVSIPDAINIILNIPDSDDAFNESINFSIKEDSCEENLADVYYSQALDYQLGNNDVFQDIDKACLLFKKSAELGKKEAWLKLGHISFYTKKNEKEALNFFHQGADNGDGFCYAELGLIYMNNDNYSYNERNANLAWMKYFEYIDEHRELWDNEDFKIKSALADFLIYSFVFSGEINPMFEQYLYKFKDVVHNEVINRIETYGEFDSLSDLLRRKIIPYLENIEEKYILSNCDGEELADNYLKIAKKYIYGIDGYTQNDIKALNLLKKSLEFGNLHANVFIGICWLRRGEKSKANNAWREYYNFVYDSLTNENSPITEQEKDKFLDGFSNIIYSALENDAKELIHEYYVILSLHMNLVDYYTEKIEELNELNCYNRDYDNINAENLNEDDLNDFLEHCKAQIEIAKINVIHSYIKEFVEKVRRSENTNPLAYRLED